MSRPNLKKNHVKLMNRLKRITHENIWIIWKMYRLVWKEVHVHVNESCEGLRVKYINGEKITCEDQWIVWKESRENKRFTWRELHVKVNESYEIGTNESLEKDHVKISDSCEKNNNKKKKWIMRKKNQSWKLMNNLGGNHENNHLIYT